MAAMKQKKEECALYIHIPFCARKCLYCDFLSGVAEDGIKERYIQALLRELESWKGILQGYRLHTIFVGGGTPTCLSTGQMEQFTLGLVQILSQLEVAEELEFTLEANPGTILAGHLPIIKRAGVNRISLGLQSAQNRELQALGRIHTYEDFLKTYDLLREHGFSNVNVDLMSDIPLQSLKSYEDTLEKVIMLQPEHISAYSLIVEEGTPFYQMAESGKLEIPSEELDRQMYWRTEEILSGAGYHRYEISNYALPGFECRHNLVYWDTKAYLGIGLGASSCLGGYRFQNTGDMEAYLSYFDAVKDFGALAENTGEPENNFINHAEHICRQRGSNVSNSMFFQEMDQLTENAQKEEFMFLGLRKMEGISLADFQERFGESLWDVYGKVLPKLIEQKFLEKSEDGERIYLTRRGIDVSNVILAEFLL